MPHAQAQKTNETKKANVKKTKPVVEIPTTKKLVELLPALGKPGAKDLIANAPRKDLDRYVFELHGKTPHKSRSDEDVRLALTRWIDGEKHWGNIDAKKANGNGTAKTIATETKAMAVEAVKGAAKVVASKEKKTKSVKAHPVKTEDGERIVGRTTGMTRASFFLDMLTKNRKAKLSDEEMLALAIAEFGEDNVPGPNNNFTPSHRRTVYNLDRKHGRRGLSMETPEFVGYGKAVKS